MAIDFKKLGVAASAAFMASTAMIPVAAQAQSAPPRDFSSGPGVQPGLSGTVRTDQSEVFYGGGIRNAGFGIAFNLDEWGQNVSTQFFETTSDARISSMITIQNDGQVFEAQYNSRTGERRQVLLVPESAEWDIALKKADRITRAVQTESRIQNNMLRNLGNTAIRSAGSGIDRGDGFILNVGFSLLSDYARFKVSTTTRRWVEDTNIAARTARIRIDFARDMGPRMARVGQRQDRAVEEGMLARCKAAEKTADILPKSRQQLQACFGLGYKPGGASKGGEISGGGRRDSGPRIVTSPQ